MLSHPFPLCDVLAESRRDHSGLRSCGAALSPRAALGDSSSNAADGQSAASGGGIGPTSIEVINASFPFPSFSTAREIGLPVRDIPPSLIFRTPAGSAGALLLCFHPPLRAELHAATGSIEWQALGFVLCIRQNLSADAIEAVFVPSLFAAAIFNLPPLICSAITGCLKCTPNSQRKQC